MNLHSDRYECPHCGKRHDRQDRLKKHVQRCSTTGKLPQRYDELVQPVHQPTFACTECSNVYRIASDLQGHLIVVHPDRYKCPYCGIRHDDEDEYMEHVQLCCLQRDMKVLHVTDRPGFVCGQCSYVYTSEEGLKSHMNIHTDCYKCPYCDRRHDHEDALEKHVETCSLRKIHDFSFSRDTHHYSS
ncbi:unnamed protein product [Ambrosiozyma monospora]|uniref:Unnamed protein product n=1 Tax=Ambrosiozyma monospora TaxID=43982 RepID=A0ACB5T576_AMBMO|nr:unnamed protein product [Ambrosiozyma monospora]